MTLTPYRGAGGLRAPARAAPERPRSLAVATRFWLCAGGLLALAWGAACLSAGHLGPAVVGGVFLFGSFARIRIGVRQGSLRDLRGVGFLSLIAGAALSSLAFSTHATGASLMCVVAGVLLVAAGGVALRANTAYCEWCGNHDISVPVEVPPLALSLFEWLGFSRLGYNAHDSLVTWAKERVDTGLATPAFLALSALDARVGPETVQYHLEAAIRDEGLEVPSREVTNRLVLRSVAHAILEGRMPPRKGVEAAYAVALQCGLPPWTREWYLLRDTYRLTEGHYVAGKTDDVDRQAIECARRAVQARA